MYHAVAAERVQIPTTTRSDHPCGCRDLDTFGGYCMVLRYRILQGFQKSQAQGAPAPRRDALSEYQSTCISSESESRLESVVSRDYII